MVAKPQILPAPADCPLVCLQGAIPWFLMGEIFPPEVKGLASSVATACNWILSLIITKTVTALTDAYGGPPTGLGGVFLTYGAVCFLGAIFVKVRRARASPPAIASVSYAVAERCGFLYSW